MCAVKCCIVASSEVTACMLLTSPLGCLQSLMSFTALPILAVQRPLQNSTLRRPRRWQRQRSRKANRAPKIRAFWDIAPCSLVVVDRRFRGSYCLHHQGDEFIVLIMEAVHISETSISYNETTRRNIPEVSNLHTRFRENLKCHKQGSGTKLLLLEGLELVGLFRSCPMAGFVIRSVPNLRVMLP
jgi:hypothetical protein